MSEKIVTLNEEVIKGQIRELVRGSVEVTLNELLEAEEEKLTQAARYHERRLNENIRGRLKYLTEMGIVEHVGRNKYVLARSLYNAVGKSGIHTRIVGLDRDTNKELFVEAYS